LRQDCRAAENHDETGSPTASARTSAREFQPGKLSKTNRHNDTCSDANIAANRVNDQKIIADTKSLRRCQSACLIAGSYPCPTRSKATLVGTRF
jgi:hypothetical protein